jgi:hypothetical protein
MGIASALRSLSKGLTMAFGFKRGDMPEAPPSWADSMGMAPGFTVKRLPTLAEVDAYCRANGVNANDAYNPHGFVACVIPTKQEVVLPAPGVLHDPAKEAAVQGHEYFHTWGPEHHDGRGWFVQTPSGVIPVKTPADLMAGRLYAAQQARDVPQRTDTATTVPMRGR